MVCEPNPQPHSSTSWDVCECLPKGAGIDLLLLRTTAVLAFSQLSDILFQSQSTACDSKVWVQKVAQGPTITRCDIVSQALLLI